MIFLKAVPNVLGLDGRPMPRKAIKTKRESDDKFWDFARQFFFGLWRFRQRPYPPGRPIDVAQAIGYKRLERRYYDCKNIHTEDLMYLKLVNYVSRMLFVISFLVYLGHYLLK